MTNIATKRPFNLDTTMTLLREAVRPFPKAAMFELAERGFASPFHQLVACIVSIRTRDEASLPISLRLFETATTPKDMAALPVEQLTALIRQSSFADRKAEQIRGIARKVEAEFGGELPCDEDVILSFSGVGVKCANLTLGIACGQPKISVDIHVHRVCNRWGIVNTITPEKTTLALEGVLPERYHVEINSLLVPFGKHICTGERPRCSTCPLLEMCRQVGVTSHR